MSALSGPLYVALCVVGPAAWGVAMYFAFELIDKRRNKGDRASRPPIDYSI